MAWGQATANNAYALFGRYGSDEQIAALAEPPENRPLMQIGWRYGRAARVFFTAFAVLVFIASVHLGWHYAIDGYAGVAITWALWSLMKRMIRP